MALTNDEVSRITSLAGLRWWPGEREQRVPRLAEAPVALEDNLSRAGQCVTCGSRGMAAAA